MDRSENTGSVINVQTDSLGLDIQVSLVINDLRSLLTKNHQEFSRKSGHFKVFVFVKFKLKC